jgi:hypothetical protein
MSPDLERRNPQSWVQTISHGRLHVPSYDFLNLARSWNSYFIAFHDSTKKWKVYRRPGALTTISGRISTEFPTADQAIIKRFVKIRTFIRIKYLNVVILNMRSIRKEICGKENSLADLTK